MTWFKVINLYRKDSLKVFISFFVYFISFIFIFLFINNHKFFNIETYLIITISIITGILLSIVFSILFFIFTGFIIKQTSEKKTLIKTITKYPLILILNIINIFLSLLINIHILYLLQIIIKYINAVIFLIFLLLVINKYRRFIFSNNDNSQKSYTKNLIIIILTFTLLLIVLINNAWVSDDSYITFRTCDNFINGYGLIWNIGERVQAYTNPLWMFIISGLYFITNEIFYTVIFSSIIITIIAFVIGVLKNSKNIGNYLIGFIILISSKAFIDFSTSGLENPFIFLMLALFISYYLNIKNTVELKDLFVLCIICSISMLNRLDSVLFFIPAIIKIIIDINRHKRLLIKTLAILFVSFLPFIIWEVFSILYYGFPFPNTFYGKLNSNLPLFEYIIKGLYYYIDSLLLRDPITPTSIFFMLIYLFRKKNSRLTFLLIGIALYLIYIVRIGGDFMSGRFLSAPLFALVTIFVRYDHGEIKHKIRFVFFIIIIGLLWPFSPITSGINYRFKVFNEGIADEKGYYYQTTGLLPNILDNSFLENKQVKNFLEKRIQKQQVIKMNSIGFDAFYADRNTYIIDEMALADPLLSKLPFWRKRYYWRTGHLRRYIPHGYYQTKINDENRIVDENLAEFYNKIKIITQGEIFSKDRLETIWKMNTGQYNHLINHEFYKNPDNFTDKHILEYWFNNILKYYEFGNVIKTNKDNAVGFLDWNVTNDIIWSENKVSYLLLKIDKNTFNENNNKITMNMKCKGYGKQNIIIEINNIKIDEFIIRDMKNISIYIDKNLLKEKNVIKIITPNADIRTQAGTYPALGIKEISFNNK